MQDVLVVGAGAAGLVAALRAAARGINVTLLDGGDGHVSNLMVSGGMFSAAGTRHQAAFDIADSPELWEEDIRRKTEGAVDQAILAAVTGRSAEVVDFLADEVGLALHVVRGFPIAGHSAARLHATAGESGRELGMMLLAAVQAAARIDFRPHTEVRGLATQDSRVVGVRTGAGVLPGKAVILASGGFAANRAMLAQFAPEVAEAVYIGRGPNDGAAITWARALGADVRFMDSYQGQGHVTIDGLGRLGPGLTTLGAIMVNADGQRFGGEAPGPSELAALVLAQPGGWAAEIFSTDMHQAAMRMGPYREACERGAIVSSGSVEGLAALLGVDAGGLASTIGAQTAVGAPYHGAVVTGALAHTQGGLRVDASARVLGRNGTPIAGLLAAGGAAASISGHGAAGYIPGNGLAQAFALGLIAADTVAIEWRCRPSAPVPGTPGTRQLR